MCKDLTSFYERKQAHEIDRDTLKEKNQEKLEKLKKIYRETEEEQQLYSKFVEMANKDPDKKFKIDHIVSLGTGADVIVIYGKKGIGKTYQISELVALLAETDPKGEIILMRNTVSEFQALSKQLTVSYSPIYMKGMNSNTPSLFHKDFLVGNKRKPRYMGFCCALNGFSLEAAKGAEYPNIRLIIWDECTNMGKGNAGYNSTDIYRFITFFDSIIRNKTNVQIFIFGNFHRDSSGHVSDVLLDTLRIPYGCKLKLRTISSMNSQNNSKLLYINTGSLYEGIDSDSKVGLFGGDQILDDLSSNMPKSYSNMVGGLNIFYSHEPKWGYMFSTFDKSYILLVSSFKQRKNALQLEINWMVHMEVFPSVNEFVHDIYTAEIALFNAYRQLGLKLISSQEQRLLINDLYEMCLQKSLYYSSDITMSLFIQQMKLWQKEYDLGLDTSFLKSREFKE